MRVLIAGANGQLGRALVRTVPQNVTLVALDRDALDIADPASVGSAFAAHVPDLVINAAAYTAVDRAESEAEAAFAVNRDGAANLARAATSAGAALVHVSTDFVFDGSRASPRLPDDAIAPLGTYGASKAAGEAAVREILSDALILRTGWVYAAEGTNFLRTMLRLMATQPMLRVVADQVGTPTHAASLASAIWSLGISGVTGTHHFSDAGVCSWYDFAVAIQEEALALGLIAAAVPIVPIRTEDYPTPARRPAYSVLDKTSCYAALGQPAAHWRVELRLALAMMKDD